MTSDGSPVTWSVNVPQGTVCTTDDTGTCSFSTLTNISGTLSTSYSPYPDDPSYPGGFTGKVSDSVTGPGQTAVITINWEGSLITLTGNVSTETGPLGGATVSFDGVSDITDANGNYTLHPFADSTGTIGVAGLIRASAPLTVGSSDQTDDISIPTEGVTSSVQVVDGSGTPLAGLAVTGSTSMEPSPVQGVTSDGSPVTWSVNVPQGTVCTTDDTGTCSFSTLTNISGTLSTSYSPYPDDPSYPGGFTGKVSDSVTGPGQTAVITINWEGSLITLTGNVSTETGPLGGATVSFDGVSDITDANGNYTLHPFADSTGTIGVAGLIRASAPLTVGSSDQTDDISIPTEGVTSSVSVVGGGNPLDGIAVTGSTSMEPSPVQGVTSDGSPVTWSVNVPPGTVCTTDDTGTCSFSTLTNIEGTLQASYAVVPGDASYPTLTTSASGISFGPGSTTTLTFPSVTMVASAGSVSGNVVVASANSTNITDPSASPVSTSLLPPGASAPVGAIGYQVENVPVGGSVDVYIQLPAGTVPTAVYKLQDGQLVNVSSIATIAGNTITLQLTDGGLGDADGIANGVIVDPVVPLVGTSTSCSSPQMTSGVPGTATVAVAYSFPVTTCSNATPTIKASGLPKGLTLVDHRNGTATIQGTAAKGDTATYTPTITAKVKGETPATQSFSMTVDQLPVFMSKTKTVVTAGSAITAPFEVLTRLGNPEPALSATGLPAGVTLHDNANGTGDFVGTPAPGSGGLYTVTISATNVVGTVTQTFAMYNYQLTTFSGPTSDTVTQGVAMAPLTISYAGYPAPAIKAADLPKGLSAVSGGGTITISGTPTTKALSGTAEISATNKAGTALDSIAFTVNP